MLTIDAYPANQAFPAPRIDSRIQISSPAATSAPSVEVPDEAQPPALNSAQVTSPAASAAPTIDAGESSPLSPNVEDVTENTVIGQAPYGDRAKTPQDVTW
jgi:hypothetical protein